MHPQTYQNKQKQEMINQQQQNSQEKYNFFQCPLANYDCYNQLHVLAQSPQIKLTSLSGDEQQSKMSTQKRKNSSDDDQQICSSPIQVFMPHQCSWNQHSHQKNNKMTFGQDSPCAMIIDSGSFKKILQKQNEDEQIEEYCELQTDNNANRLCDLDGNTICEFNVSSYQQRQPQILQDKQNDIQYLQTPLKNNRNSNNHGKQMRSPLQDITPSITKKKKKSSALRTISDKNNMHLYLTPRTMAESRFSGSSGLRRIQRL